MSRPTPLHLLRLAQGSPGQWLTLPGAALRVLALRGPVRDSGSGYLVCLSGAAVVDLPEPTFVQLRSGEAHRVGGEWQASALEANTTLLLVPDER
ncbi:hypothetical protein SAMN04488058_101361 [Deinococcus reticulitermitis]|uniref:Cupin n=1 Tax=Deinococcus reticulitermitis TaxID=856736 RepID=A0A1H6SX71_9DEIO|nr:hypothetical protein [Deinococcus reticulitermitis]SEI69367.1 hypothetical protein SAMN04488058_101361 [Deinococcus reticulitermitis]